VPAATLTFDNGPWPGVTDMVLDVLADRDVQATFFVVGAMLEREGAMALVERAHDEGHRIGNHSAHHAVQLGDDPSESFAGDEIGTVDKRLGALLEPDHLFRPYARGGIVDQRLLSRAAVEHLQANGHTLALWNSVPRDWELPVEWPDRALADIEEHDWAGIVLHDAPTGAMAALGPFIDRLRDLGVELRQELPPSCVPIRRGVIEGDLSGLLVDPRAAS